MTDVVCIENAAIKVVLRIDVNIKVVERVRVRGHPNVVLEYISAKYDDLVTLYTIRFDSIYHWIFTFSYYY